MKNWLTVLIVFPKTFAEFHHDAKEAGIEVIASETFIENPITQVEHLKVQDNMLSTHSPAESY